MVIATAQLHSTKPELRLCGGSNPARGVLEIRDGEDIWQGSRLEIRLNAFRRSTIPQKQFIIIVVKLFFLTFNSSSYYRRCSILNWKSQKLIWRKWRKIFHSRMKHLYGKYCPGNARTEWRTSWPQTQQLCIKCLYCSDFVC